MIRPRAPGILAGTLILSSALCALAAPATQPTGWRGDGTGKYPDADPPTRWGRVSRAVAGLRFQAAKPADAGPGGRAMSDGVVREWLVLGPVPFKGTNAEAEALPDEAGLDPADGDKAGPAAWKKVDAETAYLNFAAAFGKPDKAVDGAAGIGGGVAALACTRVYADAAGTFRLNLTSPGNARVYVNGKPAGAAGRVKVALAKGWNRILLKVLAGEADWYAVPVFHAAGPGDDAGIVWRAPQPGVAPAFYGGGQGVAAPVIVGDRIYVASEPSDLICLRKSDGKVLWLRRHSYFEAATDEERGRPEYADARAIAEKVGAIDAAFVAGTATDAQLQEKAGLEKKLQSAMKRVAPDKYAPGQPPDVGFSGLTPTTDGHSIYVASETGVAACFDPDGNRRWIRVDRQPLVEHGFSASPLLVDGKLVTCMRDLTAFDAGTGAVAWNTPLMDRQGLNPGGFFHGSPVAAAVGGTPVIALSNGMIVRAADGKIVHRDPAAGNQAVASPVVDGGAVYLVGAQKSTLHIARLPAAMADPLAVAARDVAVDTSAFPKHYLPWHLSTPVVHDGLAYLVNNAGVLSVVDVEAGRVVYQRLLDLDPFQGHNEGAARGVGASLALAGGRLYVFSNNGAAVVLDPGRTFRQVAKNKLENVVMPGHWSERQERFCAPPVFDGRRLYLRGEGTLWAIGPD